MTQRERHIPDGGTDDPRATPAADPSPAVPAADRPPALVWEDLHRPAPPAPPGPDAPPRPAGDARRALLAALLHGKEPELAPLRPPPLDADLAADLDPAQREAVARALHTPDVCLVQGLPGTGKSRVAARLVAA